MKIIKKSKLKTKIFLNFIIFVLLLCNQFETINSDENFLASVNFLFETFTPYSMIRFFEFSDKTLNISDECLSNMFNYLGGLKKGAIWAVNLYDATAFYSGGTFGGNKFHIHSPDLCRQLQTDYLIGLKMHWNLRSNTTTTPFPVQLITAKYEIEMETKLHEFQEVQQLICFPKSCNVFDLENILAVNVFQGNDIVKNMSLTAVRVIASDYNFYEDGSFYILMCLISVVLILYILSYLSDNWENIIKNDLPRDANEKENFKSIDSLNSTISNNNIENVIEQLSKATQSDNNSLKKFNMHPLAESMTINNINTNSHVNLVKIKKVKTKNTTTSTISLDIIAGNCDYAKSKKKLNFETESFLKSLLKAFSIKHNFENLMKQTDANKEIATVRGLQVFCSIFMILLNSYMVMNYLSNNETARNSLIITLMELLKKQTTYIFDMFFFLGGTNLTHLYFKRSLSGSSGWNFVEQMLHFIGMIAHKVCSVILSYSIILILLELTSKHFFYNTTLEVPTLDYENCELNKWRNILYIDVFFPLQEKCMPWSWFISLEVQFFIACCLILLLAQIHPKYAGIICTMLFLISIAASTILEMEPYYFGYFENSFELNLMDFNLVYDKILLRISPYLLGMCLGYILYKTNGKFDMNIFVVVFGWIACGLIFIGFTYGFQHMIQYRINPWIRAGVLTFSHTIWSVILCWIILASISQYGGFLRKILMSQSFTILGKLSSTTYLLSPLIIRTVLLNGETGIFLSGGQFIMMTLGFLITTYFVAFVLYILFESPLLEILRIIYLKHST